MLWRKTRLAVACLVLATTAIGAQGAPMAAAAKSTVLVVPTQFSTIQSAVDAARSGDTIEVLAGTYVEQVSIDKDLNITGAGADSTIIRIPPKRGWSLPPSIVDIHGGASVALSRLTVSGPGAGSCKSGPLRFGISVHDGGHLDLRSAAVSHIHDTPFAYCTHGGLAIVVGFPGSPGTATIRDSKISDYQGLGIWVLEGSAATITGNIVTGPGPLDVVSTTGIFIDSGAVATVSDNTISGNVCVSIDLSCGTDWFTEYQMAGIRAAGAGTEISHNLLYGNQVGIYAGGAAEISENTLVDNDYFGIALQDGAFTVTKDQISGGVGGIAVIAMNVDTEAVLDDVQIAGTSGPAIQEFECCGFTATTIGGP